MHELADSFFSALDSFLTPPTANFHRCSTRVFASKEERRERERERRFLQRKGVKGSKNASPIADAAFEGNFCEVILRPRELL